VPAAVYCRRSIKAKWPLVLRKTFEAEQYKIIWPSNLFAKKVSASKPSGTKSGIRFSSA